MNRLYVFYNMKQSKDGSPFAMCDKCKKEYRAPEDCVMRELATHSSVPCNRCGELK